MRPRKHCPLALELLLALGCIGLRLALHAAESVELHPDEQKQLISNWGYDIKEDGKAAKLTPNVAQTLFVDDRMTCLRVPIYGDIRHPAHPAEGKVVESFYTDVLQAMTNARQARSNVIFFASKKLEGKNSFPAWTVDPKGVIAARYAGMLADYLQFMAAHGFVIDVLGIDNEVEFNHGNITPSKQKEIVDGLRTLAASRGYPMPRHFIGPDGYNPKPDWLNALIKNGWGNRLDMVGTHYYPDRPRPIEGLQDLVEAAGGRPLWNTELHWQGKAGDIFEDARESLAAFFDCTDNGFSGFVWWEYTRTGIKGGIEKSLTQSTLNSHPIKLVNKVTGPGKFIMRAFRRDTNVVVWAVNVAAGNASYQYHLASGALGGNVEYVQWNTTGSTTGQATRIDQSTFALPLPPKTVTEISIPLSRAP